MAPKSVVVTGASTGIGRATALRLDRLGWRVFAGVRRDSDADDLRAAASERLTPLIFDVTDPNQIEAAAKTVADATGDAGLDGLVNNAGIAVAGPLEFVPIDAIRMQLEVNVVGVIAVTQTFLPFIRDAKGRIVNIGSIGGTLAVPFAGPYSASKFALEAITDALRLELAPWEIEVCLIKPAAVATPIWERGKATAEALLERMPERGHSLYARAIDRVRMLAEHEAKVGIPPEDVARLVVHALASDKPKTRYFVGPQVHMRSMAARLVPDRLRDAMILKQTGLPKK